MAVYAAATAGQAWIMEPILDRVFLERDRQMLLLVPLAVVAIAVLKGVRRLRPDRGDGADRPAHRSPICSAACSTTWSGPMSATSTGAARGR